MLAHLATVTVEEAREAKERKIAELEAAGEHERAERVRKMPIEDIQDTLEYRKRESLKSKADRERERQEHADRLRDRWQRITKERLRYQNCALENYIIEHDAQRAALEQLREYAADLRANVTDGRGIVLFGPCGTGKDHLLAAMLRLVNWELDGEVGCEWVRGVDLIADAKEKLGWKLNCVYSERRRITILAISDPCLPGESLQWHAKNRLYQLVDDQYSSRSPIWITVNVSNRGELIEMLGPQVTDRILDNCLAIYCDWPSFRKLSHTERRESP